MKRHKGFIFSLIISIFYVMTSQNIYSQKWKIDRKTGDSTLTHLIIKSQQGHVGTNYYYMYFQKQKDEFTIKLLIEKDMSNQFIIAVDKPMEICLVSNDTLKFYSKSSAESGIDFGLGLYEAFDKQSSLDYSIDFDDIIKIRDNDYFWAKIYYYSQLDRKLVQTEQDENGFYFRLKHAKKDRKRKNRKKTEHIQEFLDAL